MTEVAERGGATLQRPYTENTFQQKLQEFHALIKVLTFQDTEATPEERRQLITENLRFDQFCESIRSVFGSDIKNQDLKALYRKITTNPDAKVDWSELFGYFQSGVEEEEPTSAEEVSVFTVSKRRRVGEAAGDRKRRDTVQCIRYIPNVDLFVTVSQKGGLSIWNGKMRLQACTDINESAWSTGCDYLPTLRRVACCTERSIVIWDNRAKGKNQSIFSIKPIEHSPQCMTYIPIPGQSHEDTIMFGDDQGYINVLSIAAKDLTMKNSKGVDRRNNNNNLVLEPHKLTSPIRRRKLHDDWVLKVRYFPELRCFASCSPSSSQSFVLEEIERIYDNGEVRGVAIPKGVNAFDYCARANIIATGGVDKAIRLWHPHIFSRPTGKLMGHLFTIVDICCNERDQHIISLSTARVIRVWDIHTLTSLQVFTDNEERPGEKRIYSMIFDNKHEKLVTGSSVIDAWPLTRSVQDTMQVPHTHDRPISQVLYNAELNQVITVCTESVIKVWEMEAGKLVYQITDAHGPNIELTAIALDKSGYRLASGAYDGSLKVWDFGSGQEIKWKTGEGTDEDLSITGLIYSQLGVERVILVSGWNNRVKIILDSNDNYDLPVLREFSDVYYWTQEPSTPSSTNPFNKNHPLPEIGQQNVRLSSIFRKESILVSHEVTCADALSPNVLITGCHNGNIVMWNIEKSVVDKVFEIPEPEAESDEEKPATRGKQPDKRVHMVRVLVRTVRKLDPEYIKSLTRHLSAEFVDDGNYDNQSRLRSQLTSGVSSSTDHTRSQRPPTGQSPVPEVEIEIDDSVLKDITKDEGQEVVKGDGTENADKAGDIPVAVADGKDLGATTQAVDAESMVDPDAKMIVEKFEPIIVSVHQDAYIRFWTMEGLLLREVTAMTRRQGSAVTAVCTDLDCNIMVTGDNKGYLTLWDIAKFLEDPESEEAELIKQLISWRAHLVRVVSLCYVDSMSSILSGSADGSTRIWWGKRGRFIGFFGQHRPFNFPVSGQVSSTPTLPYDITEGPLAPLKSMSARQRIRAVHQLEYPLIFDQLRWKPFRRSAYVRDSTSDKQPEDKKFFEALIKPKAYNHHLESFTTGEMKQGAVFRALPVYRVTTPDKISTPDYTYAMTSDDSEFVKNSSQFNGTGLKVPKQRTPRMLGYNRYARRSPRRMNSAMSSSASTVSGSVSLPASSRRR
ncbi:WD repeat-containing protein 64-like [Liolophura sinensis]|uniref:WD repeat-containing protein 64-like n=1 Tax=Liolophura sinensis TaxID=3198878 RepID=UPI003157FCA1